MDATAEQTTSERRLIAGLLMKNRVTQKFLQKGTQELGLEAIGPAHSADITKTQRPTPFFRILLTASTLSQHPLASAQESLHWETSRQGQAMSARSSRGICYCLRHAELKSKDAAHHPGIRLANY